MPSDNYEVEFLLTLWAYARIYVAPSFRIINVIYARFLFLMLMSLPVHAYVAAQTKL